MVIWNSCVTLEDGLTVDDDADFSLCTIERLPRRMKVGGHLYLVNSTLLSPLPDDLEVIGLIQLGKFADDELRARAARAKSECESGTHGQRTPASLSGTEDENLFGVRIWAVVGISSWHSLPLVLSQFIKDRQRGGLRRNHQRITRIRPPICFRV
jgi:hypothetical protein